MSSAKPTKRRYRVVGPDVDLATEDVRDSQGRRITEDYARRAAEYDPPPCAADDGPYPTAAPTRGGCRSECRSRSAPLRRRRPPERASPSPSSPAKPSSSTSPPEEKRQQLPP